MRLIHILVFLIFISGNTFALELTEEFEKDYISLGGISGTATLVTMIHVDSDSDGVLDSVAMLYNDGSRFELIDFNGARKWTSDVQPPLNKIGALTTADLNGDGISSEIIVGAQKVIAFDSDGQELWSFKPAASVYSLASGDIDSDGKDEIIVGGFKKVYALDSIGNQTWSFTLDDHSDAIVLADLDSDGKSDSILAGDLYSFHVLDLDGREKWAKAAGKARGVSAIITADLDSDGYETDIVVAQQDGTITAYNSKGEILWTVKKPKPEDPGVKIKLYPLDIEGKGYLNHVLVSAENVYVLTPGGQGRFATIYANSVVPVDFDSDGRTESLIAGSSDKIFAYNSNRIELGYYLNNNDKKVSPYNRTGADVLIPIDYDGDGFLDDVMGVIGKTHTLFILEHKSLIDTDKDGDGLSNKDELNLYGTDPNRADTDGDGWNDGQEITSGTNASNKDTDADGIWDSQDANPLDPCIPDSSVLSCTSLKQNITTTTTETQAPPSSPLPTMDSDGDGLTDEEEKDLKTNPYDADTDGDGIIDSEDTEPLVPEGQAKEIPTTWIIGGVIILILIVGIIVFVLKGKKPEDEWGK